MTINNIPPQAYTKEDVARAYVWIQTQPDYVKNMATSKETLVALYLQSRRNGNLSFERTAPVSSKDFQSQLKNLANELNQFESEQSSTASLVVKNLSKPKETITKQNQIEESSTQELKNTNRNELHSSSEQLSLEAQEESKKSSSTQAENLQTTKQDLVIKKTLEEFKARPQTFEDPLPSNSHKKTFQFQLDPRSEQIIRSVKAQLNVESEQDIIRMLLVLGFDRVKSLFPNNK